MSNVTNISAAKRLPKYNPEGQPPGGGGGDDVLEEKVKKLEDDVSSMKLDLAVMKSNYATKESVVSSANKIILWVVGAVVFSQLLPAIPRIIEALSRSPS